MVKIDHSTLHPIKPHDSFTRSHIILVSFCFWIVILHVGGLYLFTRGFLLARLVLEDRSSCALYPLSQDQNNVLQVENSGSCWIEPRYKKAVIIVIDALRFDFVVPLNESDPSLSPYYTNKLTYLHELLTDQPSNALLFQYVADPPTTTLQRLKGLTTGTLPTFIDAGRNFAGSAITEDNLIDQLKQLNRSIAFMGDDTWTSLFPTQFHVNMSWPYPSFNVWDLYTVDNGIIEHLLPTIKGENKWDVIIAHFLGVDHCGHRFGPDHPAMADKLQLMNNVLHDVVKGIDDETLLLVMGDHGMDSKGDHGGDSDNEVESSLFVYSKKQLYQNELEDIMQLDEDDGITRGVRLYTTNYGKWRSIPQIDLVPSLALLIGLPIPFNNLGAIIPELFFIGEDVEKRYESLLSAVRLNAQQIYQYANEYSLQQPHAELSTTGMEKFRHLFDDAEYEYLGLIQKKEKEAAMDINSYRKILRLYMQFLRTTLQTCRHIWAQFDYPLMVSGLVILFSSCGVILLSILGMPQYKTITLHNEKVMKNIIAGGAIGILLVRIGVVKTLLWRWLEDSDFSKLDMMVLSMCGGSVLGYIMTLVTRIRINDLMRNMMTRDNFIAFIFLLLHTLSFASNSFTIHEDSITLFLLQTFGFITIIQSFRVPTDSVRKRLTIFASLFVLLTRISHYSTICREEQMPGCTQTFYASSANSISSPSTLTVLIALAPLIPEIIKWLLNLSNTYNGIASLWIGWGLRAGLVLSAAYWIMDDRENANNTLKNKSTEVNSIEYQGSKWLKNFIVRMAFGLSMVVGNTMWWKAPLCLNLRTVDQAIGGSSGVNELKQERKRKHGSVKNNVKKNTTDNSKGKTAVVILGFGNALGSSYFVFVSTLYLLVVIVQKPMGGIMTSISIIQMLLLLEILDLRRDADELVEEVKRLQRDEADEMDDDRKNKKNKISAASDNVDHPSMSLPPHMREQSGHLLSAAIFTLMSMFYFFATGHQSTISSIQWSTGFIGITETSYLISPILITLNTFGSQILFSAAVPLAALWNLPPKREVPMYQNVMKVVLYYMLYNSLLTLSASFFAAWFRRHLMVWKIFAPRFMLGGLSLVVSDLVIVVIAVGVGVGRVVVLKTFDLSFTYNMDTGRFFIIGVTILISFLSYSSQYFIFWEYLGGLNVQTLLVLGPFNFFVLLLAYNYYLTCTTDPGRVPNDWRPNMTEDVEVKKSIRTPRYCKSCKSYKPPRAHHCKTCQRCVLKMDHHCPWTNNCIGYYNYSHFLRFIFWVDVTCIYHFALCIQRTYWMVNDVTYTNDDPSPVEVVFLVLNIVAVIPVIFSVGVLSCCHFYCLCSNTTTIETWEKDKVATMIRRGKIKKVKFPYDLGCFANYQSVLGKNALLWCWPQHMSGNGIDYSIAKNADPDLVWPPKDPTTPSPASLPPKPWHIEDYDRNFNRRSSHNRRRQIVRRDSEGYVVRDISLEERQMWVDDILGRRLEETSDPYHNSDGSTLYSSGSERSDEDISDDANFFGGNSGVGVGTSNGKRIQTVDEDDCVPIGLIVSRNQTSIRRSSLSEMDTVENSSEENIITDEKDEKIYIN
ncbi:279_t:CDS:2 [Paraglomus brasilianum]|uniref:Palmitoyltransferase PFA4 n=1 Tax=Paraglomus brasilianum TaxID=144538 RepID=A0A9N9BUT7_9GLOM|nr:279_t:CDS:2 [Paraglomus brasilianum]